MESTVDPSPGINMSPLPVQYASLGRRLLALFLDSLILAIPCAIAGHILPFIGGLVVWFFYAPILEASGAKATLGKYLMGIQVVDPTGKRISFRAALVRNVLKFVSSILLFIGFFFALFSSKKQTLHDMLADTFVVYGRTEQPLVDLWLASVKEAFNAAGGASTLSELERLQALREKGALTEEEFQRQKSRVLNEM